MLLNPQVRADRDIVHSSIGSESPSAGLDGFPALLVKRGLIAASDLVTAQSRAVRERIELADAVVALGVSESDSYAALAAAAGVDVIALGDVRSSDLAVRLVPERLARRHSIVPLEVDNRVLTYATCLPFNLEERAIWRSRRDGEPLSGWPPDRRSRRRLTSPTRRSNQCSRSPSGSVRTAPPTPRPRPRAEQQLRL